MLSTACENHSNMFSLMLIFVFGDVLYFGDCAPTNSTKTAVQAFNTFSIFPFIMFICYAVFYFYAHVEMADRLITYSTALLTQFLICLTGCIFAGISINNFNEPCIEPDF